MIFSVQFLVTLAVGEGFKAEETYKLLKQVHAFHYLTPRGFFMGITIYYSRRNHTKGLRRIS
ncbi:hypothetical protein [Lacinutrix neustonica]|uniref:hypothetical protein n=1 Tax=Lacinutrix neustonica TaxID=2980107 RepID=UPI0028BD64F5|nr:hypothetical protein [Lacinutrix neustonica]